MCKLGRNDVNQYGANQGCPRIDDKDSKAIFV